MIKTSFRLKHFFKPASKNISLFIDSFGLTEDQKAIQEAAYDFAEKELWPHAHTWDMDKHFPIEVYKKGAELGFGGITVGEEYGGSGLGRMESSLIFEALSTGCVGSSAYISIHNMCAWMIYTYASDEQKKRWLPNMVTMDVPV